MLSTFGCLVQPVSASARGNQTPRQRESPGIGIGVPKPSRIGGQAKQQGFGKILVKRKTCLEHQFRQQRGGGRKPRIHTSVGPLVTLGMVINHQKSILHRTAKSGIAIEL